MGKAVIDGELAVIDNDTIKDNEIVKKELDTVVKQNDSIKREVVEIKKTK